MSFHDALLFVKGIFECKHVKSRGIGLEASVLEALVAWVLGLFLARVLLKFDCEPTLTASSKLAGIFLNFQFWRGSFEQLRRGL